MNGKSFLFNIYTNIYLKDEENMKLSVSEQPLKFGESNEKYKNCIKCGELRSVRKIYSEFTKISKILP